MIVKCIGDPTFEFEIGQLEPSLLDSDFVTRLRDFGMKLKKILRKNDWFLTGSIRLKYESLLWVTVWVSIGSGTQE